MMTPTHSRTEGMTRYHPRSPGARLKALRRALWEEDRATRGMWPFGYRVRATSALAVAMFNAAEQELNAARDRRMEAERELWEAGAGHGLD